MNYDTSFISPASSKKSVRLLKGIAILLLIGESLTSNGQSLKIKNQTNKSFQIPNGYLIERENIPPFWISSTANVIRFIKKNVHKGTVEIIGKSAGGKPIYAVFYGKARQGKGTSTFSGALGFGNVAVYRGKDHQKRVYMGIAGVHGGEFEGIVGIVNLIAIIETGKDLRGIDWPDISASMAKVDRLIFIPIVNPDGRDRIPLDMELFRGQNGTVHEYLNTGGKADGTITGWPMIKEFIPLDFPTVGFPGGYPNDAGVNIQHDDFFGQRQPETQALFNLTERGKPDLLLNMRTGATYVTALRAYLEPALSPTFDSLYTHIHTELALNGLQKTKNPAVEANPRRAGGPVGYNLDGALNLHLGY